MEIDGASNRGIEEIRRLRDSVSIAPVSARYKIYIIDEVHMLTREAFNALLKTLEEPPTHVKFFFATTEPHKIPATILSRVQKFELRRVEYKILLGYLNKIAKDEKVKIDEGALSAIAIAGNGSVRDALSVFDQVLALTDDQITEIEVVKLLGWTDREIYLELNNAVVKQDAARALEAIGKVVKTGHDPTQFILGLLRFMRNLLLFKSIPNAETVIEEPVDFLEKLKVAAGDYTSQQLLYSIDVLLEVLPRLQSTEAKQTLLEITVLKLLHARKRVSLDEVFARLAALESGSPLVEKENAAVYQTKAATVPVENVSKIDSAKTAEEEKRKKKEALINKAKNEPIVKKAFELFPGSTIIDVEE
jgi:DNA polymerase-3 subunit gamma/tau